MKSVKKEIEFKSKRPFLIRESSLNRLVEIIQIFFRGIGANEQDIHNLIIFEVVCADNATITTDEIQEVFNLENHGSTSIKKLSIYCNTYNNTYKNLSGVQYRIEFSTYDSPDRIKRIIDIFDSIYVRVISDNPENGVILMNSLKTYIENSLYYKHSVCFTKLFWRSKNVYVETFMPAVLMAILGTVVFLIFKSNANTLSRIILTILTSAFILLSIFLNMKTNIIASRLPYIFDFGSNPEDYKDRIRIIKIVFGILGPIFFGVLSALLYDILFK